MSKYRSQLPQLGGALFLADGGIETTLIFLDGLELPDFAAFDLLKTAQGTAALRRYYDGYARLAKQHGTGLVLESATWRANADWGARLGYSVEQLRQANQAALRLLFEVRAEHETAHTPIVVSGCLGPRGDGYLVGSAMSEAQAQAYHLPQIQTFADGGADMACVMTMNYVEEAVGVTLAARHAGIPLALSFTVETDGRLPSGQALGAAIEQVDAASGAYPSYYMINCAHPAHFEQVFPEAAPAPWQRRIRGLRANASRKSHAELNEATVLDSGNPAELAGQYARLRRLLPKLNVMGGCCGTDLRHIEQIALACAPLFGQLRH